MAPIAELNMTAACFMGYIDFLDAFGVQFSRHRPDIAIPGSPERCLFRSVVEDV